MATGGPSLPRALGERSGIRIPSCVTAFGNRAPPPPYLHSNRLTRRGSQTWGGWVANGPGQGGVAGRVGDPRGVAVGRGPRLDPTLRVASILDPRGWGGGNCVIFRKALYCSIDVAN